MTAAQTLVALIRLNLDSGRDEAEHIIRELDEHQLRVALRESSVLLATAIRIICDNDRHQIDSYMADMGATVAAFIEGGT